MAKDRASRRARLRQKTAVDSDSKRDGNSAFAQEYSYVLKDLRRVFAAIMFVLLIVLNIVLQ